MGIKMMLVALFAIVVIGRLVLHIGGIVLVLLVALVFLLLLFLLGTRLLSAVSETDARVTSPSLDDIVPEFFWCRVLSRGFPKSTLRA